MVRPVTQTVARKCSACGGEGFNWTDSKGRIQPFHEALLGHKCSECDGFGLVARKRDGRTMGELIDTLLILTGTKEETK